MKPTVRCGAGRGEGPDLPSGGAAVGETWQWGVQRAVGGKLGLGLWTDWCGRRKGLSEETLILALALRLPTPPPPTHHHPPLLRPPEGHCWLGGCPSPTSPSSWLGTPRALTSIPSGAGAQAAPGGGGRKPARPDPRRGAVLLGTHVPSSLLL